MQQFLPEALAYEEFQDINDQELACIFAETGMDREYGFDKDNEIEKLFNNPARYQLEYPQLQYTK